MRLAARLSLACTTLVLASAVPAVAGGPVSGGPVSGGPERTYVVVLSSRVDLAGAVRDARRLGAEVLHVYGHALNGYAATLSAREAAKLRSDKRVAYLEPDRAFSLSAQTEPTGIRRIGARQPALPDSSPLALEPGVAVVDTGIDLDHPDLGQVVSGVNCTVLSRLADDDNGHGTHVAGTIAALDNDQGVVGVAPGVPLYAVKVFNAAGAGSLTTVLCGIDWVTANAALIRVANLSLGSTGRATPSNVDCSNGNKDSLHTAICVSTRAGTTYVVAAGNDARDASSTVPAAYEEVIAVSALSDSDGAPGRLGAAPSCRAGEADDRFASFSNYGSVVDLAAPGVCIYSTTLNGGYATKSGTSMAAPHVSGAAALYLRARPTALPADVRAGLIATSEPGPIFGDPDQFAEGVVHVGSSASAVGTVLAPAAPSVPALPWLPALPGLPQLPDVQLPL
jgi:subtilisin family serine protease